METERFFEECKDRAHRKAFRRILNRKGGEPPRLGDTIDEYLVSRCTARLRRIGSSDAYRRRHLLP